MTRGWVSRVRSRGRGLVPVRSAVVRLTPRTGFLNQGSLGHQPFIVGREASEDGLHAHWGVNDPGSSGVAVGSPAVRLPWSFAARRGLKERYRPPEGRCRPSCPPPLGQATHGVVCRVGSRGRGPAPVACIRVRVVWAASGRRPSLSGRFLRHGKASRAAWTRLAGDSSHGPAQYSGFGGSLLRLGSRMGG